MLRCFQNLYYFDLVDKVTFFIWREEVDPNYPAKGHALFEVSCSISRSYSTSSQNIFDSDFTSPFLPYKVTRWLNWLETVDDDEEIEDNEDDDDNNVAAENAVNGGCGDVIQDKINGNAEYA